MVTIARPVAETLAKETLSRAGFYKCFYNNVNKKHACDIVDFSSCGVFSYVNQDDRHGFDGSSKTLDEFDFIATAF